MATDPDVPATRYPADPEGGQAAANLTRIDELTAERPDQFGGAYWDAERGRILLNVTNAGAAQAAEVSRRYRSEGRGTPLATQTVRLSMNELENLHQRVSHDAYAWLAPNADKVTSSLIDLRINAIIVDVQRLTADMVEATASMWGDDVRLRESPPSQVIEQGTPAADTPPFYGSIMWEPGSGGGCTAAFPGKVTNTAGTVFDGLLTAGHCGTGSSTGYHNGYAFDLANRAYNTASGGTKSDAMVLRPHNGNNAGYYIYTSKDGTQTRAVRAYASSAASVNLSYLRSMTRPYANASLGWTFEVVNDIKIVSKTGECFPNGNGGSTCGAWPYFNALYVCDTVYPTAPGDSGAPIYTLMADGSANAFGHHVAVSTMTHYDSSGVCRNLSYLIPVFTSMSVSKFTPNIL